MLSQVCTMFCDTFHRNVSFFQWMNTVSLPSSKWPMNRRNPSLILDSDYSTPEPILSRRRPLLSSSFMDRQRRSAHDNSTTERTEVTSEPSPFPENATAIDEPAMNSTDLVSTLIEQTMADNNETLSTVLPPGNETSVEPVSDEHNTAILLFNYTTVAQSTLDDSSSWMHSTIVDESINETSSNITFVPESSTVREEPICDRACQCTEECPHGFDIVEDQCQCDPPCKVNASLLNDCSHRVVQFLNRIITVLAMIYVP